MSRRIVHIHPEAPAKPAPGAACNGCGLCCLTEPCPVGMLVSRKRRGACTALQWNTTEGRYRCGLLNSPSQTVFGRAYPALDPLLRRLGARWIGAGVGCDAHLEVEPM